MDKFVTSYDMMHSNTELAPSLVIDKYVLRIWEMKNGRRVSR